MGTGRILLGRGDDTVGNPHRAQIIQFELFDLIPKLKSDKRFSIEQFEPTVSQSAVPSPPLFQESVRFLRTEMKHRLKDWELLVLLGIIIISSSSSSIIVIIIIAIIS